MHAALYEWMLQSCCPAYHVWWCVLMRPANGASLGNAAFLSRAKHITGTAPHGTAQHGTAQHSRWHSTAQHSMAQHGTSRWHSMAQ
jgi:hypothetical protein